MKHVIMIAALLLHYNVSTCQTTDFIVIKKNKHTVQSIFTGSMVNIKTADEWIYGTVVGVKNDSIFFKEIIERQVGTIWGTPTMETLTMPLRRIHYNEIVAIPRRRESFTYIKNGSLFMIGGAGYMGLNLLNSSSQKYAPFGKENMPNIAVAAGVFGLGKLLRTVRKPYLNIGKKYRVRYIKA